MMRFFALIFTIIFFAQNTSYAYGGKSLEWHLALKSALDKYNSLSQDERKQEILKIISARPESDQKILKRGVDEINKTQLPDLSFNGTWITFTLNNQNHRFFPVSSKFLIFDGKLLETSPGKLQIPTSEESKSSMLDFFMGSAYALDASTVTLGGTLSYTFVFALGSFILASAPLLALGSIVYVLGLYVTTLAAEKDTDNLNFELDAFCKLTGIQAGLDSSTFKRLPLGEAIIETNKTLAAIDNEIQKLGKTCKDNRRLVQQCNQAKECLLSTRSTYVSLRDEYSSKSLDSTDRLIQGKEELPIKNKKVHTPQTSNQ